ncbi:hypothetical protein [Conexibacter sp. CPCC 206217]|uniref:hypothetical protein n=1 Tax=Conexibacter sp. CPCC 206217 TaxID=3064574 RepID=UPI0027218564|nr:hypothetical protein [Conexibacter sp. CPCC 206217]MDO8211799.1 hypothetical protein [Conexibacter sp. CPCC 206217]
MTIRSAGRLLVAGLAAVAVALALAACGSSSDDGESGGATATTPSAAGGRDRAALAACMREQGVELPTPPAGAPRDGPRIMGGFGRDLSDAERSRLQAALEKCGGRFMRAGPGGAGGRAGAPSAAALQRFVACVRRNGYDLPDPNTSGDGPAFDDSTVDRDDPAFIRASRACQQLLQPAG